MYLQVNVCLISMLNYNMEILSFTLILFFFFLILLLLLSKKGLPAQLFESLLGCSAKQPTTSERVGTERSPVILEEHMLVLGGQLLGVTTLSGSAHC